MTLKSEEGGVLVGVIWVTLLLGLLTIGVMELTLVSRQTPQAMLARKQAENIAESAATLFLHQHFLDASGDYIFSKTISVLGQDVSVQVEFEDAKVGLNKADYHLLSAAIASKGYSAELSENIADAIIDWRDADDIVSGNGAESDTYQALGLLYGPRNGPFETVGELRFVRDVTAGMVRCLASVLTVYARPDVAEVELEYATQDTLNVFNWANQNSWHNQIWPDVNNIGSNVEDLDVSRRAITLRMSIDEDSTGHFSKTIRIKASSDDDIVFAEVRSLRRESNTVLSCNN